MVMSEIGNFATFDQQQQAISTGGYYFEILTGWLPAFETVFKVRSREIATKESKIRIETLWVRLQGEIGRQSSFTIELLISNSSKRHSFDCSSRTDKDREKATWRCFKIICRRFKCRKIIRPKLKAFHRWDLFWCLELAIKKPTRLWLK